MRQSNKPKEIKEQDYWTNLWEGAAIVKMASLHQAVAVAGFSTEKTVNKDKLVGAELRWCPEGLLVAIKDARALIPAPNVAMLVLE